MARTGRPAFAPTDKQRGQVEAMAVVGIPEDKIAQALEISGPTLRKYFRPELDNAQTKVKVQVGSFIVNSILGTAGARKLTDERAIASLAMFFAKTRMGWSETVKHAGPDGEALQLSPQAVVVITLPHNGRDEPPKPR